MRFNIKNMIALIVLAVVLSGCFGIAPTEWKEAGFRDAIDGPSDWRRWKKAGFEPQEARKWYKNNFSCKDAIEWKNIGSSPIDAALFRSRHLSPSSINELKTYNLSLEEIRVFASKCYNIKICLKAGVTVKDLKDNLIDATKYDYWMRLGLTATDIKTWGKIFEPDDYDLVKEVKTVQYDEKYINYKDIFPGWYYQRYIVELIKSNLSIRRLKEVESKLLEINNNKAVYPSDIIGWAKTNLKVEYLPDYIGIPDDIRDDAKKLEKVVKICNSVEDTVLSRTSPFSTAGKCYSYYGKVRSIRNRKMLEIQECLDEWCDGRVSLMVFSEGIPNNMSRDGQYIGIIKSHKYISTFLFGNSSKNTELISPVLKR